MTATDFHVLTPAAFAHHIEGFNSMEDEHVTNAISNANSWSWLQENIPLFECPDRGWAEAGLLRELLLTQAGAHAETS